MTQTDTPGAVDAAEDREDVHTIVQSMTADDLLVSHNLTLRLMLDRDPRITPGMRADQREWMFHIEQEMKRRRIGRFE